MFSIPRHPPKECPEKPNIQTSPAFMSWSSCFSLHRELATLLTNRTRASQDWAASGSPSSQNQSSSPASCNRVGCNCLSHFLRGFQEGRVVVWRIVVDMSVLQSKHHGRCLERALHWNADACGAPKNSAMAPFPSREIFQLLQPAILQDIMVNYNDSVSS